MNLYVVANWNEFYENNRSRKIEDLRWLPIPNSHDGEKYTRLITGPDGPAIFAAWILILQVASRCTERGRLVRSNGKPHDAASLSLKTRAPMEIFDKGLPYLHEIGWIISENIDLTSLAPDCRSSDVQNVTQVTKKEEKRIEEKEGWVSREVAALPEPLKAIAEHWERWIVWWAQNKNGGRPMSPETAMEHMEVLMPLTHAERIESIKNSIAGNYARLYAPKPQNGANAAKPEKARIAYG